MIYLIDLEYVETRYTAQWKTELPQSIADETGDSVTIIEGDYVESDVTSGTFLDFSATNSTDFQKPDFFHSQHCI